MTSNELSTLLSRNKHKFIFYSYFGGMGGEFILNYLADNSPNIISQRDFKLMEDAHRVGWDEQESVLNKYYFADTIFCHYFLYEGLKAASKAKDTGYVNASDFDQLAEKILTSLENDGHKYDGHDFNSLFELDQHEDMRYLIKTHWWYDEIRLFKNSKNIHTVANQWETHCILLEKSKNETNYSLRKNDKIERIKTLDRLAKFEDPFNGIHEYNQQKGNPVTAIDIVTRYLSDIIENDDMPLYNNTIQMALRPVNYNLDMSTTRAGEINNTETLRRLYFSIPYLKNTESSMEYTPQPLPDGIEATVYSFNDIALGKLITREFGLDIDKFSKEFDDWFDKNIVLLNKLGISSHHIPNKLPFNKFYIPRNNRKSLKTT